MPIDQKIRIISGGADEVEYQANELLGDYVPIVWNIQPGPDGPLVTCVLIAMSELRKAQILAAAMPAVRTS
jgi:hypothetical protein